VPLRYSATEREANREGFNLSETMSVHAAGLAGTPLAQALCADMERRWAAGQPVRVEQYLEHFPSLAAEPQALIDLIYAEYLRREQFGPPPTAEEYLKRFPALSDGLRRQLDVHALLCGESVLDPAGGSTDPGPENRALPGSAGKTAPRTGPVTVPGYEILGELGRGGMGVVYQARHVRLNRIVALKMVLAGSHAGPDEQARFLAEAEAVAHLQHPHIVQIYETGQHNGLPFMALEFVEAGSLARKIKDAPLAAAEAARVVEQLARGMAYAHSRGIVHRDLKPENVLLAGDGTPKVTDFGLAKRVDGGSDLTQTGAIMGTPSYMAPEQARGGSKAVGPAADVYALGAILYQLLTGRPPFQAPTAHETVFQVIMEDPVPPRQLNARLPRDLETICLKCLRKEVGKRYPSALALADDLHRFLASEPIQARPVRLWERGLKWARRRPALAALVGVLAVAVPGLLVLSIGYNALAIQTAKQQQKESERLALLRAEGQRFLNRGQEALDREQDLEEAKRQLLQAQATVSAEPALLDFRQHAEDLLQRTYRLMEERATRQQARIDYQQFLHWRDEALFHGMLFIGVELPANPQAARSSAETALRLFGASAAGRGPLVLGDFYSEREKVEIAGGCYELLLILAEAQPPGPDQAKQALRHLERAAELHSPTRAFHLRRSRYLHRLGDRAGADRENALAGQLPPQGVVDHFLLGDEQYKRGRLTEALGHFDAAVDADPGHFWAKYFLAVCQLRLGHPGEARASLTHCLAQRPDFCYGYLLRGLANTELGKFNAADRDFQETLDHNPNAYARYGALVNRGVMRVRQEKLDVAAADLRQAVNLLPDQNQAYVNLAQVYQRQHRDDEAARLLEQGLGRVRDQAALYRTRARLDEERTNLVGALRDIDRAIALEPLPGLADDHLERGRILHRSDRPGEAVTAYDKALAISPGKADIHRGRAEALLALKQYREALVSFDRYLQSGKQDADVSGARGLAHAQLGEHAAAIEDYTQALRVKPGAGLFTERGWAYLHCESWRLALRDFEEALRLDPTCAPAYTGRGYVRIQHGTYADAIKDAEKAARLQPPTPRAKINLACVFALAAGKVSADAQQPDREALKRRWQDRALELIRRALDQLPAQEQLPFWREVAQDPDFDSLRDSAGFKQLEHKFSAPARQPGI
jgi:serine/threonine protein kinase/Tfp pilus assembly protein PilF